MTKLFFILGITLIALGVKAMMDFKSLKDSPVRLQAQVTSVQPPGMWMRLPQSGRMFLTYTVNGHEYRPGHSLVGLTSSTRKPGDRVDIIINANKPQQFVMADTYTGKSALGLVLCVTGVLLLAVAACRINLS